MKTSLPYILAITIAAVTPALAAEDGVNTLGIGISSCKEIAQLYHDASTVPQTKTLDLAIESWSSGFMTAVNYERHFNHLDTKNLGAMPLADQVMAIRRYCKHNPGDTMLDGIVALIDKLPSNTDSDADSF